MKTQRNTANTPVISVDLFEAARRSETFPKDWTSERIARAHDRYEKFLLLVAANPGVAVAPTRDIDEMWHLHMLSPRAYYEDCARLFGAVLDHDGGFGKESVDVPVLKATFEHTSALWEKTYGEPYVIDASAGAADQRDAAVNCWHDCTGRCWHACSNRTPSPPNAN